MEVSKHKPLFRAAVILGMLGLLLPLRHAQAAGATLSFTPPTGSFAVGSTFNLSILLNTGGQSINAVRGDISFPAGKLQVVNPTAGTSFISIWVSQPTYSNTAGTINFQGGLPNPGIKTDAGIVSTITFRATSPGTAKIVFNPTSQVLANDGQGTNILNARVEANLTFVLPAPEGPNVTSTTDPDQSKWYQSRAASFSWDAIPGATGYSYSFDENPHTSAPERTDATTNQSASVTATEDGRWYFHVRAKTDTWGGTSHFPVLIDATPPAAFTPVIDPATPAPGAKPELRFLTTDALSGIEHYEMQLIALTDASQGTPFFVEQTSPVRLPELVAGKYEVIVRAFDQAGNSTDGKLDFTVAVPPAGSVISRIPLLQNTLITNIALISLGVLVLALATWLIFRRHRRPTDVIHDIQRLEKETMLKESELLKTIQAARSLETSIESQVNHSNELHEQVQQITQQPKAWSDPAAPTSTPPADASPSEGADFLNPTQPPKL